MSDTTQSRKLIQVALTYDDGTRAWLEGDAAQEWANAANGCISLAYAHGVEMPDLPWEEMKISATQGDRS